MRAITTQRWWFSLPFLFALAVLVYLAGAVSLAYFYPYDGIVAARADGFVLEIDPNGPSASSLQRGDQILTIDGVPFKDKSPQHAGKQSGDLVSLVVQRENEQLAMEFRLVEPNLDERFDRIAPLIVASIFWMVGVGVQAFKPAYEANWIYFLFFQIAAVFLISGGSSRMGPHWTVGLYSIMIYVIGPISVHFHLNFPQKSNLPKRGWLLIALYAVALLGGIVYLLLDQQSFGHTTGFPYWSLGSRLFLALNFVLVVGLLIYSYRHSTEPGVRGKIRIVVLGGLISLLPLVVLAIIPDAIAGETIIPLGLILLFLGILPLTYGYAIFRHRLIEVERHVNRGASYIFVYSILGGIYLILYALIDRIAPNVFGGSPIVNIVLVMILASIIGPLHRRVQIVVDTFFYGGWYDYRTAVTRITQGLEQITDLPPLSNLIGERLVKTLHLQDVCVFFRDHTGDFTIIDVAPHSRVGDQQTFASTPLPRSSLSYLVNIGEIERASLQQALSEIEFSKEEHELLNTEQVHLWVPVIGHGQVQGLLALGPKFGGDIFSGEDMDILRIVARQLGPLVENVHLVNRLRQYAADLEIRVKERTDELHDAKERVEAILASVGEGVVVIDLNGIILTVNPAYEQQTGFPARDLPGVSFYDFLKKHNSPEVLEEMQATVSQGGVWRGDLTNQQKDGSKYDVHLSLAPVRDQGGQIVNYVGSLRDITHQKELDRMKDTFVSDVSHELRTPTTNISLYLELMDYASAEKQREYLETLKEQTRQLRTLVEDILDLSRLSMGKFRRLEFAELDLNTLVKQVVIAHRPMADASGLELDFVPDVVTPVVRGEENQLARLVTNLISNSLRYTAQGKVCARTYVNDQQVCLEICDTGMGIDPEDLPHLFERFYRGKRVRQGRIHGTGLGLAIVKEIVDLHEAKIEVESHVNEGSRFTIRFPLVQS